MNRMNRSHPGNCIPISSNCVKWDGTKLCCIDVCSDDSITEVIAKEAEYICYLAGQLDLTELDYKCLGGEGAPQKKLLLVLQYMIDNHCSTLEALSTLADRVTELENEQNQINNPIYNLPEPYQYTEEGDLITQLPQDEVIPLILEKTGESFEALAALETIVDGQGAAILALQGDIQPPTPIPEIVVPEIMGDNDPHEVQDVVLELAEQFNDTRDNLGTLSEMIEAISTQSPSLAGQPALSVPGNMEDITGWVGTVTNLSESLQNLWITVIDIRAALEPLIPAPTAGCAGITIDFGVSMNGSNQMLKIFLFGYSTIPAGFNNCDLGGSVVDIEDEAGNTFSTLINLTSQINNALGFQIDLSGTPLNTALNMDVTINACLTNGVDTCNDVVTHTAINTISKCPGVVIEPGTGMVTVGVAPFIQTATYLVSLYDNSNVLVSTQTFVNPVGTFTAQWTSQAAGDYEVRITVQITDVADTVCSPLPVTIL